MGSKGDTKDLFRRPVSGSRVSSIIKSLCWLSCSKKLNECEAMVRVHTGEVNYVVWDTGWEVSSSLTTRRSEKLHCFYRRWRDFGESTLSVKIIARLSDDLVHARLTARCNHPPVCLPSQIELCPISSDPTHLLILAKGKVKRFYMRTSKIYIESPTTRLGWFGELLGAKGSLYQSLMIPTPSRGAGHRTATQECNSTTKAIC